MKHLKTFELVGFGGGSEVKKNKSIFTKMKNWFKSEREGDGLYFWTDIEINELENIGFERNDTSDTATFTYTPLDPDVDIKIIQIKKLAEVDYNSFQDDYFYKSEASFVGEGKILNKDFEIFEKLVEYVNGLIEKYDPAHREITKYNL